MNTEKKELADLILGMRRAFQRGENAMAWLATAERDVEMLKEAHTTAAKFVTNSEGETESWGAKMTPEEFEETVQSQFNIFKENFLKQLDKQSNKHENN